MKIVFAMLFFLFFTGCVQPTALIGPIYTIGTTGNALQAGASYGTSYIVKKATGKTVLENMDTVIDTNELKKELKDNPDEFFRIVNKYVKETKTQVLINNF
jgi:hypothetical protein